MAKKIIVPPVDNQEVNINVFSDKLNQILNNVKIIDNGDGTESAELELDDRVISFIIDQSGSMTWNDSGGFRHQIVKKIIEDIEANYPGNIRYNLYQYGAIISNMMFFGIIEQDGFNPNDIDSLSSLYFADDEANFAGIRVVRNIERIVDGETLTYPTSPIDGEIVSEGFTSKAFEDDLITDTIYYYTVYIFDKNYRFSKGRNVRAIPKNRIIPKGVTIFNSFKKSNNSPISLIGSGVQRDDFTLGIWHMDEREGNHLFDFSDTKANLALIDNEPSWVSEKFVPAGEGGMYFNGIDDHAYITDEPGLWIDQNEPNSEYTIMAWVLPYKSSGEQIIVSSYLGPSVNYEFGFNGKKLFLDFDFAPNDRQITVEDVLVLNQWQHVAVTTDGSSTLFYVNGELKTTTTTFTATGVSNPPIYNFAIGAKRRNTLSSLGVSSFFYGKITETSIHNVVRDSSYINKQVLIEELLNPDTGEAYLDPITSLPIEHTVGLKGDNGDRLNILKYTIPEDADYLGGNIVIVRNDKEIPAWEQNGTIIHTNVTVSSGEFFVTDADDFVLGETYYYKIYSQNSIGNFSYRTDSPSLSFDISTGVLSKYLPELTTPLEGPSEPFGVPIATRGNKKVGLRWKNDSITDDRVKRVKIYFSTENFPTINPDGGSSGTLVFTGTLEDNSFVHREISNYKERFYTIVNIDKYGRNSATQLTSSATASDQATQQEEALIPLLEVNQLHYEIVNDESVSIIWDQPIKRPENLDAFFGETALLYATITDEFGQPIPDDSVVEMVISPNISRETEIDDVFSTGGPADFADDEAYTFINSGIKNGIIQASLSLTSNSDILSQIASASFTVQVKSYITGNTTNQGLSASDNRASSNVPAEIQNYINIINELIDETDESEETVASDNIFEYVSSSIEVNFTNPWELEITNRDEKIVDQRCYFYKKDEIRKVETLNQTNERLDGIYMRASDPFVARVKVTYKGEPVSSGFVDLAVWDADANLCQCATAESSPECKPSFTKTNVSEIVTLDAYRVPIILGSETIIDSQGNEVVVPISYVDVPLYAPDAPLNVQLYAKSTFAGFSSLKSFDIVFQNILRIDLNAQIPEADGVNTAEQQSTVYIVNPDSPDDSSLYVYPDDQSIVQWDIQPRFAFESDSLGGGLLETLTMVDIIDRNLYSLDNVPLSNGVYSYTRTGTARNVFLGPVENKQAPIEETYELSATISYQGLSDIARQEIIIDHAAESLQLFSARFLMEMEYPYLAARGNKIWTDGVDFKKLNISRNPNVASYPDFLYGELFRECADQEDSPLLELNPNGQIVTISGTNDTEFLWGEVIESVDPYTGRQYLETTDNTFSAFGTADIELNDEEVSDKTTVYIRINSFSEGITCNREVKQPCVDVNLPCLNLTSCQLPLGSQFLSGETFILIDGEPVKLIGGGEDKGGVPPCPICSNEPLRLNTVWTKIDGVDTPKLGEFPEDLITVNSEMDIRLRVSFAGLPVPEGTPITVIVGNNDGRTVFGAFRNIELTSIQDTAVIDEYTGEVIVEADGNSYVDVKIIILNIPEQTTIETIKVFSTYNEVGDVSRKVIQEYQMTLKINDTQDPGDTQGVIEVTTEEESTVYSKTLERYDIENNEWSYATNMGIARSAPFAASVRNKIYVFGGFIDNDITITPRTEIYDPINDSWEFGVDMVTPRFGGQTVVIGDYIYIIGGCYYDSKNQNLEVSNVIEKYNVLSGEWGTLTEMPSVGVGVSEEKYGVAYGFASHVELDKGSETLNYIYILSGAIEVYDSQDGISIEKLNDRILRYCVEQDSWDITSYRLIGDDLAIYQRISPLGFAKEDQITIFNGAFVDTDSFSNVPIFNNEVYTISVEEDLDLTDFLPNNLIGKKPLAKYQSALVEYFPDPSSSDNKLLFVLGGANDDSLSLDLIERLDTSSQPYQYASSADSLSPLLKGRNALGAAFAYGLNDEYGVIKPFIYVFGGKTSGNEDGFIDIILGDNLRCKLDGKQSITFPIELKRNGRFLKDAVNIIIRGFVKFSDQSNTDVVEYESGEYQKNSANLLDDKTIVYPVLFSSNEITIINGKGAVTLLPRSEDILSDLETIQTRAKTTDNVIKGEVLEEQDTPVIIEAGIERNPYKVSIEATIVDDNEILFGQTIDRSSDIDLSQGDGLFEQNKRQVSSNLIVDFYNDIEWLPSIESMLTDNAGTAEEALIAINNLSNEIPFGSSAMYDALTASAELLSNNNIDEFRKIIYLFTDNDSNMSVATDNDTIDDINAIDGFKKVPVLTGNLQITEPITLSVKANTTDTVNINKLGFLTGGQSVTVVSEDSISDIVEIFYGEAVGALGYGYYEFVVDLQDTVMIDSIVGNFTINDERSGASWQLDISDDGYTFTTIEEIFAPTDTYQPDNVSAKFIKFKTTLLTGFSTNEYMTEPESPILNSFKIVYNSDKTVFLFLHNKDDGLLPYQMIIATDANEVSPNQIEVGLAKSDSSNWIDFLNGSQPSLEQNGKTAIPVRFSQDTSEFMQEPLIKVDNFTLKTSYGSWDPYSSVIIYNKQEEVISSINYKLYPRQGLIVFNNILPYDYVEGDYSIGIINGNDYRLGFKITNRSNADNLEIYGIGKMYTTGKDLLPPIEKLAPEAQDVEIDPEVPNIYSVVSVNYIYSDANFEPEDTTLREVKWYINGVHISYLDGLLTWNDLTNPNDPLYKNILSFNISDLEEGESAETKARLLGESILNVGDTIFCTIKVSDGELFSPQEKSKTVIVSEGKPTISNLRIQAFDSNGAIVSRVSSNNVTFVTFDMLADTTGNQSEIIWYVDGFEFKRGVFGQIVAEDEIPPDRLQPGEVSLNTGDWALKLGNEIYVQVVPNTGSAVGDAVTSDNVIVENALPEVTNATILPTNVTQFSSMILTWDFADFDIDVLQDATQSEETVVKWYLKTPPVNASQSTIFREVNDPDLLEFITTDVANHTSTVDSAILNTGQQWYATLTPNDGFDDGDIVITDIKTIVNG